jgi:hypothetical protein
VSGKRDGNMIISNSWIQLLVEGKKRKEKIQKNELKKSMTTLLTKLVSP